MQNKIIKISSNTVKDIAKSLKFSSQRNFTFSFSMRIAFFLGGPPQKKICSIFNAVFNIVKKTSAANFYMGYLTVTQTSAPGSFKQIGV